LLQTEACTCPDLILCPPSICGKAETAGRQRAHDDVHIAFEARSRDEVDAFVEAARRLGATVLHEPQEWWYGPKYYGGFVRDPDGNIVEARCVG
jgi:predicted lactoylglutathione lyase